MQNRLTSRSFNELDSSSNNKSSLIKKIQEKLTLKALLGIVIVLLLVLIGLVLILIRPQDIIQGMQNDQLISEVKSLVKIESGETPVIATVTNPDELRNANGAQAQIYANAETGDYVIGYSDRLIIYRRSSGQIIYDGVTPSGLVNEAQQKILESIIDRSKSMGIIPQNSTEVPQISIITDIASLRRTDAAFYGLASNNDIVGLFPQAQMIVIYNQESNSIINSGKYSTSIQSL